MADSLSKAQVDILKYAIEHNSGILSHWYLRESTVEILLAKGYIYKGYVVIDRDERVIIRNDILDLTTQASNCLLRGLHWSNAVESYHLLQRAMDLHRKLTSTDWRVTDKALEAIRELVRKDVY